MGLNEHQRLALDIMLMVIETSWPLITTHEDSTNLECTLNHYLAIIGPYTTNIMRVRSTPYHTA